MSDPLPDLEAIINAVECDCPDCRPRINPPAEVFEDLIESGREVAKAAIATEAAASAEFQVVAVALPATAFIGIRDRFLLGRALLQSARLECRKIQRLIEESEGFYRDLIEDRMAGPARPKRKRLKRIARAGTPQPVIPSLWDTFRAPETDTDADPMPSLPGRESPGDAG